MPRDGVDLAAAHLLDSQRDTAVVEQQDVAGAHVVRQFRIVKAHALLVAECARGIEDEAGPVLEGDATLLELADADLRALQVAHDADRALEFARRFAHGFGTVQMIIRSAVGEIHPYHVHTRGDHPAQDFAIGGCRTERGDDLGAALHEGSRVSRQPWPRVSRAPAASGLRETRETRHRRWRCRKRGR